MPPISRIPATEEQRSSLATAEGRDLKNAASACAKSPLATDHQALQAKLVSPDFVARLDPDGASVWTKLRLNKILNHLGNHPSSSAHQVLLAATKAPPFQNDFLRIQAMIYALVPLKPPPPAAMEYWQTWGTPSSLIHYDVSEALCQNRSPEAMALMENRLLNPQFTDEDLLSWALGPVRSYRYEKEIIVATQNVTDKGLPGPRLNPLVMVIFDDKPEKWFDECGPKKAMPLAKATPEARRDLEHLGKTVLNRQDIDPSLLPAVKKTLSQL